MIISKQTAIDEINKALQKFSAMRSRTQDDDFSDIGNVEISELIILMSATIERNAPANSKYSNEANKVVKDYGVSNGYVAPILAGILKALLSDYNDGYLRKIEEIIQADIFSDFLEMSEYLLNKNYKDAAAVLAGGVLEEHLRKLCLNNAISIMDNNEHKKVDRLNADLANANVYNKLNQKSVVAWLDLRNKAAHGQYSEYTKEQVMLMVQGIRDFITRSIS